VTPDAKPGESADADAVLARITVPWGGQRIELLPIRFDSGGAELLRVRIREGRRFTIFDIDAVTARSWGETMVRWALSQPGIEPVPPAPGDSGKR
jgi:hypothetical protein